MIKPILIVCLLAAGSLVRAQTTPVSPSAGAATMVKAASSGEKAVLEAERQRFEAQISKNYDMLDKVLADDMVYTHSNGNMDTKQSYIQSIRDGKSKYDAIEVKEQKVRVYGNTAVINGMCVVKAMNNGETINTPLRYTDVYVKKGGRWQLVAWQSLKATN